MRIRLEIPGAGGGADPALCPQRRRVILGIRALLVQAGRAETDWGCHPANGQSHPEVRGTASTHTRKHAHTHSNPHVVMHLHTQTHTKSRGAGSLSLRGRGEGSQKGRSQSLCFTHLIQDFLARGCFVSMKQPWAEQY